MEKELITQINKIISKPEYLKDIKQGIANQLYLDEVHVLLKTFVDKGSSSKELSDSLGEYMLHLRSEGKTDEEDLIIEAMTFLEGLCTPEWSLKDH